MKFGVFMPQEPLSDVTHARDLAQAFEAAGFDYFCAGGHLLTARPGRYNVPDWLYATACIDPFLMFAHIAGYTSRIRMISAIVILPALPTALVARQSVELAFLSGDRFELGVGLSWQDAEYRALGYKFSERGRRLTEQLEVLKRLWAEPVITFKGEFHDFDGLGLGRTPNKPIPLWLGTGGARIQEMSDAPHTDAAAIPTVYISEKAHRRVARYGDGWMTPVLDPIELMPQMRQYLREAGRGPDTLQVMHRIIPGGGGVVPGDGDPDACIAKALRLEAAGVTHVNIWPDATYEGVHENRLKEVIKMLGLLRQALA
jgi:alkanesulfonate monooxygenase SsuD/methylene tetrahydromethanopterin reductase-like flavin-dependent oxidoreductase (luciferase family)